MYACIIYCLYSSRVYFITCQVTLKHNMNNSTHNIILYIVRTYVLVVYTYII